MIVRESPLSKKPEPEANWPPKSPREALLISPARAKRLQQARRNDLSPTPSKRRKLDGPNVGVESETDIEGEEEALKLELKAIEIRQKLNKIRNARRKATEQVVQRDGASGEVSPEAVIEIPLSPKQNRLAREAPESPRRVQLGIDKGLRASDVSLKKARSPKPNKEDLQKMDDVAKPKSFSERLADIRTQDRARDEKKRRTEKLKSKGFGLNRAISPQRVPCEATQHQHVAPDEARDREFEHSERIGKGPGVSHSSAEPHKENRMVEPNSGFALSKRSLDNAVLLETLAGKTIVSIPHLLKDITGPDFDPPDFPTEDFVVMGIVASKSSPRDQQGKALTTEDDPSKAASAKFMAITLTDLQWSLDLYLFDSGFARFWKLTVGTVVAILNPGIMPPKPHLRDTGRFSLKLSSSEDTILEIGKSADLGFCASIKKDGKTCGQWVNKRKTEFCDFHVNLAIEKTTSKRMEINGMSIAGLFGMANAGGKTGNGRGSWKRGKHVKGGQNGPKREGQYYDRQLGESAYIVPPGMIGGRSTAKLLDAEDYVQGALSFKERSRKRLADKEKERELSEKLAEAGSGMGGEYMRIKGQATGIEAGHGSNTANRSTDTEEKKDAAGLGLVGASAAGVTLSPVKAGRRVREGPGAQPMGWSGAFTRGLLSPSRKKSKLPAVEKVSGEQNRNAPSVLEAANVLAREIQAKDKRITADDNDDDGLDIV